MANPSDLKKLQSKGWFVFPSMVVKENQNPYVKCVGAVKKGRVSEVYWSPSPAAIPAKIREKLLSELKDVL